MNAEAECDALIGRDLGVALDHRPLDFDAAIHRIDDAAEFNDAAVAGALDDAAVMHRDGWVDQVASERTQPRQNPVLVGSGKPGVADDIGHQDRGQFPGLAHGANAEVARSPVSGLSMAARPRCTKKDVEAGSAGPACRLAGLSTPC